MDTEFAHLIDVYFDTRRNKRYGRDALAYEVSWVSNLVHDYKERRAKTFRIRHNYAFLTSVPRWREIMATECGGRIADHEICEVAIPSAEKVLSPYTFNNRKGMGAQAAMNMLIEHICTVSQCYTQPCRIIKLDIKGYFPNAMWDIAFDNIAEVIDLSDETEERKNYLKWLAMISVHCNPAAHCECRTPTWMWNEHIDPEKSILCKPAGIGAAIGRLIWQTAMGLYINDDIIWLTRDCGLHVVCFVDDITMVVPEELHEYALAHIPLLRERFAAKGLKLNEKKFYDQPYGHGVEFLGSHIKPMRIHVNDKTYKRAVSRIVELNSIRSKRYCIDEFLASVNSYTGLLKARTEYKRIETLRQMISPDWWQYTEWDGNRKCVVCKPGYTLVERINRKYKLKLKNHDKTRNRRAA